MRTKDEVVVSRRQRSSGIGNVEAHQPAPSSVLGGIASKNPAPLLTCRSGRLGTPSIHSAMPEVRARW